MGRSPPARNQFASLFASIGSATAFRSLSLERRRKREKREGPREDTDSAFGSDEFHPRSPAWNSVNYVTFSRDSPEEVSHSVTSGETKRRKQWSLSREDKRRPITQFLPLPSRFLPESFRPVTSLVSFFSIHFGHSSSIPHHFVPFRS